LAGWQVGGLAGWLVGWLVGWCGWFVGWLAAWQFGWLIGWLLGFLVCWLVGWLVVWLICLLGDEWRGEGGWLTGWLVGWFVCVLVAQKMYSHQHILLVYNICPPTKALSLFVVIFMFFVFLMIIKGMGIEPQTYLGIIKQLILGFAKASL